VITGDWMIMTANFDDCADVDKLTSLVLVGAEASSSVESLRLPPQLLKSLPIIKRRSPCG